MQLVFVLFAAAAALHAAHGFNRFQLSFPFLDHVSYAKIVNPITKPLDALTICFWERPFNVITEMPLYIFKYIKQDGGDDIYIWMRHNHLCFGTPLMGICNDPEWPTPPVNGKWMHYCFTWTVYGQMQMYENGELKNSVVSTEKPHKVESGGTAFFGQISGPAGGGSFVPANSWKGDISDFQFWDYVLCPGEVAQLANCTSDLAGNVIDFWSTVLTWETVGDAIVRPVTLCKPNC